MPEASLRRTLASATDLAVATARLGALTLFGVFILWPLAHVVAMSFGGGAGPTLAHYRELFASGGLVGILLNSLAVSVVSTLILLAAAFVVAYAVMRTTIPGKRFVSLMGLLAPISPPFLVALALILIFGDQGLARSAGVTTSIEGLHGIIVAQVLTFLPLAYVLIADVLGRIDRELEEAAVSLGAGPFTILTRITLSLARPGVRSAGLVLFILCLTDFGNPILVGGDDRVLTTEIYARMSGPAARPLGEGDLASSAILSVVLLVACLAAFVLNASRLGAPAHVATPPGSHVGLRATPPMVRVVLGAFVIGMATLVAVPYAVVVLGSLVRVWGTDWSLTLRHYVVSGLMGNAGWAIVNSITLALQTGVVGVALTLITAYLVHRARTPVARALEALALLPAALPGTVVGVGYALGFHVRPTACLLIPVIVFWKFPVAMLTATRELRQMDPATEDAAAALGAGAIRRLARVVAPQLNATALAIFVYFFISGMLAVSAVVFLVHPGFTVGAAEAVGQASITISGQGGPEHLGGACALTTGLLATVTLAGVALRALVGRRPLPILGL